MTWEEFQKFIIGKVFIVGLDFLDESNTLLEKYQTSGKVSALTDDGILFIARSDGSTFQVPYEAEAISVAERGEYTEKSTGATIDDPDYILSGEIVLKDPAESDKIKREGFIVE